MPFVFNRNVHSVSHADFAITIESIRFVLIIIVVVVMMVIVVMALLIFVLNQHQQTCSFAVVVSSVTSLKLKGFVPFFLLSPTQILKDSFPSATLACKPVLACHCCLRS